jgi:hypothetical protein
MFATILLTSALVTSTAQADCAWPPKIESGVVAVHGLVTNRSSFDLSQIRDLARKSGAALPHPPFGFYMASFGHDLAIRLDQRSAPDRGSCGFAVIITVRLALVNRTVEIARDLSPGSCLYEKVVQRYHKDAAADDAVLSRYVQLVTQALRESWPGIEDLLAVSKTFEEAGIRRLVEPLVDKALQDIEEVRREAMTGSNTDGEPGSLTELCTPSL